MGQVWVAVDTTLDREVAVKLPLGSAKTDGGFWTEARTLARISHPNVVKVFDVGNDDDQPYMVMELVEGVGLDLELTGLGALSYEASVTFGEQVASALSAAHAVGLVHRDLKPANVLLQTSSDGSRRAVLVDFGLAAARRTAGRAGSPPYMAPEVIQEGISSAASDIYSLAVLMFELLSGRSPFYAPTLDAILLRHLAPARPSLGMHPRGEAWPEGLQEALHWGLSLAPDERPATATELMSVIRSSLARLLGGDGEYSACIACGLSPIDPSRPCPTCASPQPLRVCVACGAEQHGLGLNCVRCQYSLMWRPMEEAITCPSRQFEAVVLAAVHQHEDASTVLGDVADAWHQVGANVIGVVGDTVLAWLPNHDVAQAMKRAWHLAGVARNAAHVEDEQGHRITLSMSAGQLLLRGSGVAWGRTYIAGPTLARALRYAADARDEGVALFVEPELRQYLEEGAARAAIGPSVRQSNQGGERHTPLLGRASELQAINAILEAELNPPILVCGVAGVGRTRVLQELYAQHDAQPLSADARQIWVSCPPATMAYEGTPLVEVIAGLLGLPEGEPIAGARSRLEAYCTSEQVELLVDPRATGWFGEARNELLPALRAVVEGELHEQRAIIYIDDLQNVPSEAWELVQDLFAVSHERLHLVASCRGSLETCETDHPGWSYVEVRPLEDDDVERWLVHAHGPIGERHEHALSVLRACMGLPSWINIALSDLDRLLSETKDAEHVDAERLLTSIAFADPGEAVHLRALAIAGQGAPVDLLRHILGPAFSEYVLQRLVDTGFAVRLDERGATYSLALSTVEATLADPDDPSVIADHERCAGWWLDNVGAVDALVGQRLARHMELHGDNYKAAHYSLTIAKSLSSSGGLGQATRMYAAAMHLAGESVSLGEGGILAKTLFIDAAEGLGCCAGKVGRPMWVLDATDRLLAVLRGDVGLSDELTLARANALRDVGRYPESRALLEDRLEALEDEAVQEEFASQLALILYFSGDDETAAAVVRRFVERAQKDEVLQVALNLVASGNVSPWNDQDSALPVEIERLTLAETRAVSLSRLFGCKGHIALRHGDLPEAEAAYRRAALLAGYCDDRSIALMVRITLANVLYKRGQLNEALDAFSRIVDEARRAGSLRAEWTAMVNYGDSALAAGQVTLAVELLETVAAAAQFRFPRLSSAAEQLLERAFRSVGDHAQLRKILGARLARQGVGEARVSAADAPTLNASEVGTLTEPEIAVVVAKREQNSTEATIR